MHRLTSALLQVLGLFGRGGERFRRLGLAQQGALDLLLGEAIPLAIPRGCDVLAGMRVSELLAQDVQVVSGLLLRRLNVRVLI
jgi:hypothetical protein